MSADLECDVDRGGLARFERDSFADEAPESGRLRLQTVDAEVDQGEAIETACVTDFFAHRARGCVDQPQGNSWNRRTGWVVNHAGQIALVDLPAEWQQKSENRNESPIMHSV